MDFTLGVMVCGGEGGRAGAVGMRNFEPGGKGLDRREEVRIAPGVWPADLS